MSSNKSQLIILCEDTTHFHFARKYLDQILEFDSRNIRIKHNPKGISTGSGAEFVKKNYEFEVKEFRKRPSCVLVVIIDDDTKNHLDTLRKIYSPDPTEKILLISPARNIESWFHYIEGNEIDEKETYKYLYKESKPARFAKKLKEEICLNGLPQNAPSSLLHACNELKRLKN